MRRSEMAQIKCQGAGLRSFQVAGFVAIVELDAKFLIFRSMQGR